MRFVIYREEFVRGRRTTELPDAIFATEDEATARNRMDAPFAEQTEEYRQQFSPIEIKQDGHLWTVSSPTHSRLVRLGLIDEHDPSTYLPNSAAGVCLTESHEDRNKRMAGRAEESRRPITVAEAMEQYNRIKRQNTHNSEAGRKGKRAGT
jgi:hypothetical protein